MPLGVEEGDRARVGRIDVGEIGERLLLHAGLDLAAFAVHHVELLREIPRAADVVGDQALDAERHVGQPSGGIQARAEAEAEVEARCRTRFARGRAEQRGDARHAAVADALQPLRDQHAIVAVEPHDVGDGAKRDEVEQAVEARLGFLARERAAAAQLGAQREQHVNITPTPARCLLGNAQPGWFGLTIARAAGGSASPGRWWSVTSTSMPRAFAASTPVTLAIPLSTVISRSGLRAAAEFDDLGREAVAVFESVRHR